ncbi:hypothetical protein D3C72_1669940 [compost metagenome]
MPRPDATMWRMVSSELDSTVVCLAPSLPLVRVGQASSTWSRKQWPSPSSSRLLSLSRPASMVSFCVHGCWAGIKT